MCLTVLYFIVKILSGAAALNKAACPQNKPTKKNCAVNDQKQNQRNAR